MMGRGYSGPAPSLVAFDDEWRVIASQAAALALAAGGWYARRRWLR